MGSMGFMGSNVKDFANFYFVLFFLSFSGVFWSTSHPPRYANVSYASRYGKILNILSMLGACLPIKGERERKQQNFEKCL